MPSLAVLAPVSGAAGGEAQGPLRIVGQLPAVKGPAKHAMRQDVILAVDAPGRRLFKLHTDFDDNTYVVTYSLKTRIPHQTGIGRVGTNPEYGVANNYSSAFDSRRGQLGMLTKAFEAGGQTVAEAGTGNLVVYSDAQRKVVKRVHITEKVPGFYPFGITYSPKDDRYYAVGEQSAQINVADGTFIAGGKFASPVAGVVAIDAGTLEPVWVRSVPQCQQVLYSKGIGGMVARSSAHDALYFACVSGGSPAGQTYPGHTGLVRLHIKPKGTMQEAPSWPLDYYAISGNYFAGGQGSGVTAYDASTDRFYVQSISFKTPGAFVFDGRLSAWVGFVAADEPVNYFAGLNEGLGHFYMGQTSGGGNGRADGIIVANVRQTPVPAGEKSPIVTSGLITADAKTNRLFVRPRAANDPYLVVEDLTDVTSGDGEDDDYDADTSDTPDTPEADVFYAVGATGYGAQAVQVGGGTAPATAIGQGSESLPKVLDRTRALMAARGSLDLRGSGASASGQSAVVDSTTVTEYEKDEDRDGKPDEEWPYPGFACLDAGGAPVTRTWKYEGDGAAANGATYTVVCDVAKQYTKTTVRMGASGSGTTHVKKTLYEAEAWRNRKEGAVVKTRALADGTTMELAGGADVRYGRVQASSVSAAHGRPGTARSEWRREVTGIVVTSATGSELFRAPGCATEIVTTASGTKTTDTCVALGKTISKLLPMRLRVEFPLPLSMATPKGAFSGVEQTKAEYLHQTVVNDQGVVYHGDSLGIRPTPAMVSEVYNDTTERSRTITVLAATQANVIFTVMPPYDDDYVPPPGDGGGPGPGDPGTDGGSAAPGVGGGTTNGKGGASDNGAAPLPQSAGTGTGTIPVTDVTGFLLMRRSVKDMALLVLLAGLILGGAGTAWRRRRLVEVLVTVPRKEAL